MDRFIARRKNGENFREAGNFEDLENDRLHLAQRNPAAGFLAFFGRG